MEQNIDKKNAVLDKVIEACNLKNFPTAATCNRVGKEFEEQNKLERQAGTLLWIRFIFWPALDRAAKENIGSVRLPFPQYCDYQCFCEFMDGHSSDKNSYTLNRFDDAIVVSW